MKPLRPDRSGTHRNVYESNKKKILKTQDTCGICGQPIDKTLKWPHPMCAVVDHIIPVSKGGHPSTIENLQLAHNSCNNGKSDKLYANTDFSQSMVMGNRNLPHSVNWIEYKS